MIHSIWNLGAMATPLSFTITVSIVATFLWNLIYIFANLSLYSCGKLHSRRPRKNFGLAAEDFAKPPAAGEKKNSAKPPVQRRLILPTLTTSDKFNVSPVEKPNNTAAKVIPGVTQITLKYQMGSTNKIKSFKKSFLRADNR